MRATDAATVDAPGVVQTPCCTASAASLISIARVRATTRPGVSATAIGAQPSAASQAAASAAQTGLVVGGCRLVLTDGRCAGELASVFGTRRKLPSATKRAQVAADAGRSARAQLIRTSARGGPGKVTRRVGVSRLA